MIEPRDDVSWTPDNPRVEDAFVGHTTNILVQEKLARSSICYNASVHVLPLGTILSRANMRFGLVVSTSPTLELGQPSRVSRGEHTGPVVSGILSLFVGHSSPDHSINIVWSRRLLLSGLAEERLQI